MMWPFKWNFSASTYTWCSLFFKISRNEIWKFGRNLLLAKFGSKRVKYCSMFSLSRRRIQTPVSNVCNAAPISLFWTSNRLNELPEMLFRFPFNLIGKSTMAFLTVQSWRVLKSWSTGGGPEQGFRRWFADVTNRGLVSSVQATKKNKQRLKGLLCGTF